MIPFASRLLRLALVVLLLGSVLVQVLVPVYASQVAAIHPEVQHLVVPYSVAAILFTVCGQVTLLVVWRLLSLVDRGVIFTRHAVRWVDIIIGCAVVATVLSAGVMIHVIAFVGSPVIYFLAACITAGLAFVLLMIVMRGLLLSAIDDRTELDEVI